MGKLSIVIFEPMGKHMNNFLPSLYNPQDITPDLLEQFLQDSLDSRDMLVVSNLVDIGTILPPRLLSVIIKGNAGGSVPNGPIDPKVNVALATLVAIFSVPGKHKSGIRSVIIGGNLKHTVLFSPLQIAQSTLRYTTPLLVPSRDQAFLMHISLSSEHKCHFQVYVSFFISRSM